MDNDLVYDMPLPDHEETSNPAAEDNQRAYFQFQPRTLGSLFSAGGAAPRSKVLSAGGIESNHMTKMNGMQADSMFTTGQSTSMEIASNQDLSIINGVGKQCPEHGSNYNAGKEKSNKDNDWASNDGHQHFQVANSRPTNGKSSVSRQIQEVEDLKHSCLLHENQENFEKTNRKSPDNISEARQMQPRPKILLAEDNKVNITVTQTMMKRLGHSLDIVLNGVEAVQAVQRNAYDLILMDVCMPVMDGLEATRLIRKYELSGNWDGAEEAGIGKIDCSTNPHMNSQKTSFPRKRIPIIAMTANALAEGIAECYANGMDSFVAKPVTFQKLKETLSQYIPGEKICTESTL